MRAAITTDARVMPIEENQKQLAGQMDELYAVVRKVKQPDLSELRAYLAVLREQGEELGPAERFLVSRLEGLERSFG